MSNYKATVKQWEQVGKWSNRDQSSTDACILELRDRVQALETQANHFVDVPKMVSAATDENLRGLWRAKNGFLEALRAIYDLGVAHGQARSRKVAEPAPVAGGLVERVANAIGDADNEGLTNMTWNHHARAAILEVARWMQQQGWKAAGEWLEVEIGQ
jgi:hypothetical protein